MAWEVVAVSLGWSVGVIQKLGAEVMTVVGVGDEDVYFKMMSTSGKFGLQSRSMRPSWQPRPVQSPSVHLAWVQPAATRCCWRVSECSEGMLGTSEL